MELDDGFEERAARRRATALARFIDRGHADDDDPDDLPFTPSERVALVDTLLLMALRRDAPDGAEPRVQRSVVRVFKRPR